MDKLEISGVLVRFPVEKARLYEWNPRYYFLKELKSLLKKGLSTLSQEESQKYDFKKKISRRKEKNSITLLCSRHYHLYIPLSVHWKSQNLYAKPSLYYLKKQILIKLRGVSVGKFIYILITVAVLSGTVQARALNQATPARGLWEKIIGPQEKDPVLRLFQGAKISHMQVPAGPDHVDFVVANVFKNPKGRPVVLAGGFGSNFPYMRDFVYSLAEAGYNVYLFNPPGQGKGVLKSGIRTPEYLLGAEGSGFAFRHLVNVARKVSGGQKVTIGGQSQGGIYADISLLGITQNLKRKFQVNPKLQKSYLKKVGEVWKLNSPLLIHSDTSIEGLDVRDMELAMGSLKGLPSMLKLNQLVETLTPLRNLPLVLEWNQGMLEVSAIALNELIKEYERQGPTISKFDVIKKAVMGMIGSTVDPERFARLLPYGASESISKANEAQMNLNLNNIKRVMKAVEKGDLSSVQDLIEKWGKTNLAAPMVSQDGKINFSRAWYRLQRKYRIPYSVVRGTHDILESPRNEKFEKHLGLKIIEISTGHVGLFLNSKLIKKTVKKLKQHTEKALRSKKHARKRLRSKFALKRTGLSGKKCSDHLKN